MKIQCACGAKYSFDVTPEQARQSVTFVCPACGLDSSAYVTNLVREQLGLTASTPSVAPTPEIAPPPARAATPSVSAAPAPLVPRPPAPPIPAPVSSAAPSPLVPPVPPPGGAMRLNRHEAKPAAESPAAGAGSDVVLCAKHANEPAVEKCAVCHRPICPKCMELFGYVCSPLCRQKADLKGLNVPVFAGQRDVAEKRKWRKVGWIAAPLALLIVAFIGFRIWYRLFGSAPHPVFAVQFAQSARTGASFLTGPDQSQVVFLHGGTLGRSDLKTKKEVWSVEVLDPKEIQREVEAELKEMQEYDAREKKRDPEYESEPPPPMDKLLKRHARYAKEELQLRVVGQNIWVANSKRVVRYDWETGKAGEQLAVTGGFEGFVERGNELLRLERANNKETITRIDLASGKTRTEEIAQPNKPGAPETPKGGTLAARNGQAGGAGLPVSPGRDANKPLDARKVESDASRLSLPARLALPAVLSANRNQEKLLNEMKAQDGLKEDEDEPWNTGEFFRVIPAKEGYVQYSSRLLERKEIARETMKPKSGKSALDGPINASATADIANEILNDIQRDRGGSMVMEDVSRYLVTVRRADGKDAAEWQGEVIGPPAVFPLATVNVVASNQKIQVLDKNNKKLWEATLTYNVVETPREGDPRTTGQGPCVERDNSLYVFDQGVLTAFDLKTGNVQWRLPSVGISGIFFDDAGMMYIDSTTASPDTIKYSRQIDISAKNTGLILKLDPRTGKTLWSQETPAALAYVGGKYLYTTQIFEGEEEADEDEDEERVSPYRVQTGFETKALVRIRRLNPKTGSDYWQYEQQRTPIEVRFDQNVLHLVFKKEVQVLKCGAM